MTTCPECGCETEQCQPDPYDPALLVEICTHCPQLYLRTDMLDTLQIGKVGLLKELYQALRLIA